MRVRKPRWPVAPVMRTSGVGMVGVGFLVFLFVVFGFGQEVLLVRQSSLGRPLLLLSLLDLLSSMSRQRHRFYLTLSMMK